MQRVFRTIPRVVGNKVKYSNISLAVRFDLNPPGLQKTAHRITTENGVETADYTLLSLPLYLVEALPKVLHDIREQVTHTPQKN